MSEEKAILIIEFSGKQSDWDGWSMKFSTKAELRGYRKLLLYKKKMTYFDVVSTESKYNAALAKDKSNRMPDEKNVIKLAELNQKAFMELILSINHQTNRGKIAFRLVKNCKTSEYPEGNCKLAWDRLVAKYAPESLPSLLKYKKEFENSKLKSAEMDPEDWISKVEGLRTEIKSIDIASAISE